MEETTKVQTPSKFKSIVESIEQMSVLDLHELVKHLEEKFGVSAAAVAVAAPAGGVVAGGA
ncbi:MAG TPA: 50S ribosomal protein L7/L12, partial [archaeon]|nr:50S ribosomal protein L7/L12 [archaeon]